MNDVSLVGNLVVDHMLCVKQLLLGQNNVLESDFLRVGGLANMLPALKGLRVHVCSTIGDDDEMPTIPGEAVFDWKIRTGQKTSFAHIIVSGTYRTSLVDWGAGKDGSGLISPKARWTHIAYLDVLKGLDIEQIRKESGTLSGDVCLGEPSVEDTKALFGYSKHLDYLFMSSLEFDKHARNIGVMDPSYHIVKGDTFLFEKFREASGAKIMIVHEDDTAVVIGEHQDEQTSTLFVNEKVFNVDTTGAGDLFAGFFIRKMLGGKQDIAKAVEYAQRKVFVALKRRKNEKV